MQGSAWVVMQTSLHSLITQNDLAGRSPPLPWTDIKEQIHMGDTIDELGLAPKSGGKVWCSVTWHSFPRLKQEKIYSWTKWLLSNVTAEERHETGFTLQRRAGTTARQWNLGQSKNPFLTGACWKMEECMTSWVQVPANKGVQEDAEVPRSLLGSAII